MSRLFVIEDETHAEISGEYGTIDQVIAALKHLASVPWDQKTNVAPCTNWRDCGRSYELVGYDTSTQPWTEVCRKPMLNISVNGVVWTKEAEEMITSVSG